MTISRGREWGHDGTVPDDSVVVDRDSALASTRAACVLLAGGDLHEALGRPPVRSTGERCTLLPVDALVCTIVRPDGTSDRRLAASTVETGGWMRPRARHICVTNAGMVRGRNLAPRAHPNDGRFDVVELSSTMALRQRIIARRRARTGTHVPHPDISVHQTTTFALTRSGRERLLLDGQPTGEWVEVRIEIAVDHWRVAV